MKRFMNLKSLPMVLHALLAIQAMGQGPVSPEAREESQLLEALPPITNAVQAFPGVHVDRQARTVYVDGRVIAGPEMEWIELLACTTGTREHEALITTDAQPSQIHAALLTLGLAPGSPRRVERIEPLDPSAADKSSDEAKPRFKVHSAQGPRVELFFQHATGPNADGQATLTPVHEWLLDQATGNPIEPMAYLFAGSYLYTHEGKTFFAADTGGTVASLVQFGDDLIATANNRTARDGDNAFKANASPGKLPAIGTPIRLVIIATARPENASEQP